MLRSIATALTFLTRLPFVARWSYPDQAGLAASLVHFPLVGALVGLWSALGFWLGMAGFGSGFLAAAIALLFAVVLTGGFHEDGLADSADGLGGGFDVARKLEIMRDSRIGSYGALALLLAFALKLGALAELSPVQALVALVLAHVWARWSALPWVYALPYLREHSSNKPLAESASLGRVLGGTLWALLLSAACGDQVALLIAALTAAVVSALGAVYVWQQVKGYTGDLLGAVNQAVEVAVLLALLGYFTSA